MSFPEPGQKANHYAGLSRHHAKPKVRIYAFPEGYEIIHMASAMRQADLFRGALSAGLTQPRHVSMNYILRENEL